MLLLVWKCFDNYHSFKGPEFILDDKIFRVEG